MNSHITSAQTRSDNVASRLWKRFMPEQHPETPWLFQPAVKDDRQLSYKDLNAKSHCVAAYLFDRGIAPGEVIGIISGNASFCITADIGIQYSGGTVMVFPETCTQEEAEQLIRQYRIRFLFIERSDDYKRLGWLENVRSILSIVFLGEDGTDDVPLENLTTFDRMITIGKVIWRERMQLVHERRESVMPSDIYSLVFRPGRKQPEAVTFSRLQRLIDENENLLRSKGISCLISLESPDSLHQRVFACFVPLVSGARSILLNRETFALPLKFSPAIHAIVARPETLSWLHGFTGEKFAGNHSGKLATLSKAESLGFKRKEIAAAGGKIPAGLRVQFFFLQKGLFSRVRKLFGKPFQSFILDEGAVTAEARMFFENSGYEIQQPELWKG